MRCKRVEGTASFDHVVTVSCCCCHNEGFNEGGSHFEGNSEGLTTIAIEAIINMSIGDDTHHQNLIKQSRGERGEMLL